MNQLKSVWLIIILFALSLTNGVAAVYQWSVPLEGKDKDARVFLWIPSNCKQVRGIIFASQVILEDKVCENEQIRNACTKENLAIVLVYRGPFTQFNYKDIIENVGTGRDLSLRMNQ